MKSLAVAGGILIVLILGAFLFTRQGQTQKDTLIPSPSPASSPGFEKIMNSSDSSVGKNQAFQVLSQENIQGKKVRLTTDKGDIVIELFTDSPIAASNFIALVEKRFYDGLTFHRREEGFVIQGGDPNGDGTGGPGYKFKDEPVNHDYNKGIVAMANSGPNTNGSQFFIMLADAPTLPKNYSVFGNVVEGIEVVDQIQVGDKISKAVVE